MRFKRGVDRGILPATAYWMGRIESKFRYWFGTEPTCTSAYRKRAKGARCSSHTQGEAFDLRRLDAEDEIEFCKQIQENFGEWIGVVLEPEWGKGSGYTAPHMHFQLKKSALW